MSYPFSSRASGYRLQSASFRYLLLPAILLMALIGFLWLSRVQGTWIPPHYAAWHAVIEIMATLMALMVTLCLFTGYQRTVPAALLVMGVLYGLAAGFNLAHALSFPGLALLPGITDINVTLYLGATGRFLAISALLMVGISSVERWPSSRWLFGLLIGSALLALVLAGLIYHHDRIPLLYNQGEGLSTFKIVMEWVLVVTSLMAGVFLMKNERLSKYVNNKQLASAAFITALSEVCFTLYAASYDGYSLLGHVYKLIAYGLVCQATLGSSLKQPFTELQETRASLDRLKRDYHFALENARTGIWEYNPDQDRLDYSQHWHRLLGYQNSDMLDGSIEKTLGQIHPDDRAEFKQIIHRHLYDEGPPIQHEYRVLDANGQWVWVEAQGQVMSRDAMMHPVHVVGTVTIINERKPTQLAFQAMNNRFRAIFDASADGMAMIDTTGAPHQTNSPLQQLYGEEINPAISLFEQASGPDARRLAIDWNDYLEQLPLGQEAALSPFTGKYRLDTGVYKPRWTEWNIMPLSNEPLFLVQVSDIDEQHYAREHLRENKALYRGLFTGGNAIKLLINPLDGQIIDANPAASEYYGYALRTLQGMSIQTLNGGNHEDVKRRLLQAQLNSIARFETTHCLANGEHRAVDIRISPIHINGGNMLFAIVTDTQERVCAEQSLAQSTELCREKERYRQRLHALRSRLAAATTIEMFRAGVTQELPGCFTDTSGTLTLPITELAQPLRVHWGTEQHAQSDCTLSRTIDSDQASPGTLTLMTEPLTPERRKLLEDTLDECTIALATALTILRLYLRVQEAGRKPFE
ncbi:MASE3 domain-containing protein [Larsenimonas rhizosphaerae]|uniref:histidine kinase n=1 Tax=Larsenimonas rhizosphaerae TaxID=2944682 RepID=A0AA41ZHT6_9GAMM|nr:MASE3 domain-containing protein [Larsenimonas rhizosphaerae]MCX2524956.1 PAS domain S-box protein [Larsenimonas rhizosphaerae]